MTQSRFELNEQHYRYLFENASDAIWVQDMDGNIVDANKACERLTGFTREELMSKNVKEFIRGRSLELAREVRHNLLNGKEMAQPYEQRLLRKGGAPGTMKMSTSLVIINGKLRGFQNVARDVTEEKLWQEMLTMIIDGSPIPAFVLNQQHEVTHWNTAIESLSSASSQEIVGTDGQWRAFYAEKRPTMADLIVDGASKDEIEAFYHGKYKKSQLIEGAYEAEDFFPALGGHGKWLRFTASPLKGDGEIMGAIETLQDITEEKQLQENMHFYVQLITRAQEDERMRISRELHDDVSPYLLLLTQHLDALMPSSRSRQAQALKKELEALRVQAVEALEHLRRCAQDLRPRILDDLGLVAALEWIAEDMEKSYRIEANIELTGTERSLPAEAQLLLFRIAQEALSNTRRHSKASQAAVRLEFEDDSIKMSVCDNGQGFEVPARIEDLAGVGKLGIMGMSERARLLGGTLEIKSAPGEGTQVVARLPL